MAETTGTAIPLLEQGMQNGDQAYNEGAWINNMHNQPIVQSITATPPSIVDGEAYIVATGATGDWVGQVDNIALALNSAWKFYTPLPGWQFYNADDEHNYHYDGVSWIKRLSPFACIAEADNTTSPIAQVIPATTITPIDLFEAVPQSQKISVAFAPSGNGNTAVFTPDANFDGWFNCKLSLFGDNQTANELDYTFYVNDGVTDIVLGTFKTYQQKLSATLNKDILVLPGNSMEFKVEVSSAETLNCNQIYVTVSKIR